MNTAINIRIDTSQSKLDIFIRPLDLFFSVKNTPQGAKDAVRKLRPYKPQRVLIEVTGRLEMTFVCAAHKAGLPVVVCNAGHVRKFAGASGRIAKTEKIDAQCIAHFGEAVRPRQQSANQYDINGWAHLSGSQSDAKVGQFSMQMHTQRSNFLTTQEVRYDHHEFLSRIIGPGKKPTE